MEARYGPVQALHGISLTVEDGEMVAVLGPNGAGKTTTLRAVSGTVARRGVVLFAGHRLPRSAERTARMGIAHVPEGRGTFSELTVLENLRLGAYTRRNGIADELERVFGFFSWMRDRRDQPAGTLSGGEQQMLALGRALMGRPRLLLMDEPSLGLAPLVVREIFSIVRRLNQEEKLSVLVVEQNAAVALESSNRAYVLDAGEVALEGRSAELAANDDVRRSYLGY
ncbi:MAG TPA: ABC transporter ATP-binding protein [Gaiellaceae bacterium]|nr:ABC transporter ATP-binding protein [Gaiellaceae bacterium]